MLGSIYLRTNGNPVEASRDCYKSLLKQLEGTEIDIIGIGVTGSGRQIAGLYSLTDGIINEIIAHASAAVYFDPEVDTIFEIGGQDAKYTYITNSVASDYAMNEACSAGTGSFLEESAYESLGIEVTKIADLADDLVILPGHYMDWSEANRFQIFSDTLGNIKNKNADIYNIQNEDEFIGFIEDNIRPQPEVYAEIRKVNAGLLEVDEEEQEIMDLGKNECAASAQTAQGRSGHKED